MVEKIFINQNRWEMTKWMKRNRHSFPEDYHFFKMFLYLNYLGAIIGLSSVIFMIAFLTGLSFNYITLALWLILFIGGLGAAIIANRMQLPFLQKYLFYYIKDQSIQVNFNVNEWIYHQKYASTRAYTYGLIYSLIAYSPLMLIFMFSMSLWIHYFTILIITYGLIFLLFLINIPLLHANFSRTQYFSLNGPLLTIYGILISLSFFLTFDNFLSFIIVALILGIYGFILGKIWNNVKNIAENDFKKDLISDINEYLKIENEIELKYWKWIQPRRHLIKELIESGKIINAELKENKIIKK